MATCTSCYGQRRFNPFPLFMIFLTVGIALAVGVILSQHAVDSHPDDAAAIHKCLTDKPPYQQWKDKYESNKFYLVCQLTDGRFGIQPIKKDGGKWYEKTAFVPGDGCWQKVMAYLARNAARFTGVIQ